MKIFRKNKKGITLIEMVVYLAIFGLFFTTVIQFYFSISEYNRLASERSEIQKSIILLDEHFNEAFDDAESVDDVNSIFGTEDGVLRLLYSGGYFEYSIQSSRLNFDENGIDAFLVDPQQRINLFRVNEVENSDGEIVGVKIEVEVGYNKNPNITEYLETLYIL